MKSDCKNLYCSTDVDSMQEFAYFFINMFTLTDRYFCKYQLKKTILFNAVNHQKIERLCNYSAKYCICKIKISRSIDEFFGAHISVGE
jgi:hypothetical protein